MRHFALLRASYAETWWEDLKDMALPGRVVALTPVQRDLLIEDRWRRDVDRPACDPATFEPLIQVLESEILRAQRFSPVGAAFVRLGSRAPLDSTQGLASDFQADCGSEALEVLLDSERVFDDLCLAQECQYAPSLLVRPWLEIPPWLELRAFLRSGKLVGLSQRHAARFMPELVKNADALEAAVQARCEELAGRWPLRDVVADFAVQDDQAWIVDLHPWLPWSEGALYSWEEDTFSTYSFRYLKS